MSSSVVQGTESTFATLSPRGCSLLGVRCDTPTCPQNSSLGPGPHERLGEVHNIVCIRVPLHSTQGWSYCTGAAPGAWLAPTRGRKLPANTSGLVHLCSRFVEEVLP